MDTRRKVGILGATGAVGQRFVELLERHPWFEISAVMASERSAGLRYGEATKWISATPIPSDIADMTVRSCEPPVNCDLVFSGLDASVASEIEGTFASHGYPVISNAKNYRTHAAVPLLIPEVNPDHLALIQSQTWSQRGFIVTNPNCATVGVVSAVKPLSDLFGLEAIHVTTMQALSGAGYPGVPSLDILGNVIPYIAGEEEKVASEPKKLLGTLSGGSISPLDIRISVQCNRVPVLDGHLLSISVGLSNSATIDQVAAAFREYVSPISDLGLPSAREHFLHYSDAIDFPQPARHASRGNGMTVSIGRLQPCPILDYRFVALVHNTIRGAAGGAILNAELLQAKGYFA